MDAVVLVVVFWISFVVVEVVTSHVIKLDCSRFTAHVKSKIGSLAYIDQISI